ncbi:hypothetical protein [Rhizobium sp. Root1220]|uniref:hypothetical protein n=1 Tax=Rhizobium sp. Root1220 TaxID=1736432 RepID=UPI0006F31446|nr:hypothetical protein [Rhizobium sp. Root1220]KQV83260.1 hypothetical protein ASC90_21960 [Rhizobium sp. Root1220]
MSNKCDFGAHRSPTGWIAWYRLYHHGENRIVRNGKHDIIFSTKDEADAAAKEEFLREMNSPIVSETLSGPTTKKALTKCKAERLFRKGGKVIQVERVGASA